MTKESPYQSRPDAKCYICGGETDHEYAPLRPHVGRPYPSEPPHQQSWEEEFDRNFTFEVFNPRRFVDDGSVIRVKSFISQLLSQQKQELREKVKKMKRVMVNPVPDSDEIVGYNQALQDILNLIKE